MKVVRKLNNLNKKETESELQYIWRICSAKDAGTLEFNWEQVADLLNKNLRDEDEYWTSSAYRKKYQQSKAFYEEVFSKMENDEFNQELMAQKRELQRLKVQYRDERNAWNKQNYIDARMQQKLDYLEDSIASIGKVNFPKSNTINIQSDNDLLVILSDLHIGQTFESAWGKYNSDIAEERLGQYLNEIIKIQKRHNSENVYVSISGDLISGNIHKSIQVTNRENVIDQIKIACELISSFCYELSKNFKKVTISNVSGNHSRIDTKDDACHDERLDDLIGWFVSKSLNHIENVEFCNNDLDIGLSSMDIRGKEYINCHGDYDSFNKSGIGKLVLMLGRVPYAVTFGHLHTCAVDENNGVKMIRSGSLAGSGDSYTIEKRLSGKPSQMVCVCNEKGIEAYYTVELD